MIYVLGYQNITLVLKSKPVYVMKIFKALIFIFLLVSTLSIYSFDGAKLKFQANNDSHKKNNKTNNFKFSNDSWTTFLGGSTEELSFSHVIDKLNNVYVLGYTNSLDFPVSPGSLQTVKQGFYDGFVTKFDSTGNLIWSTYIGGAGDEYFNQILLDNDCNIYLVGYTNGNDLLVGSNVFQTTSNGGYDIYVAKLDSSANFIWGTYLGGTGGDIALKAELDVSQNLIIGGYTSSFDFPIVNGFQNSLAGALDAFVAKLDSTGNLIWSTYCGGTNSEDVHAITTDSDQNIIIAGETYSSDFPISPSAYQMGNAGNVDIFITKYDSTGNRVFSTYFGGMNTEDVADLLTDMNNNIFLVGYSESNDFPIVGTNIYQSLKSGGKDAFIAKFNSTGLLLKSTFIGGSGDDFFNTVSFNNSNFILVAGRTLSSNVPLIGSSYQNQNNGSEDGIFYKFDTTLAPVYSTYIGGSSLDRINHVSVNSSNKIIFNGITNSVDFPVTLNAYQNTLSGQTDGFVFQTDSIFGFTTKVEKGFINQLNVSCYPNPFTEKIIIELKEPLTKMNCLCVLKSIVGENILSKKITSNKLIITVPESLSKGIYYLQVVSENGELMYVNPVVKK